MIKALLSVIFSAGYAHHSNKKVDRKIAEMQKEGCGIWDGNGNISIIGTDIKLTREEWMKQFHPDKLEEYYANKKKNSFL